ncbi:hypothetical protein BZA05DRAFT_393696 [Tricharina praecox]|uniref:uncharacterized protein n=1 Tax=Tricharina praecox TaxID=43433 RepID=UPI002220EC91|nr:uncharacterized protein BZA05DRAFT_393696 [Tricharina praecox]KAI5854265.1 hypothetical protein BZA05DRAFT_393696 [Tricharina praecox]
MSKEETPILPQAAAFLVISYLVYRFFFTSTPTASSAPPAVPPATTRRRLQQQIEVVHGMFPQVPIAAIEAELLRNGGNMEVATERILATGFLPDPPRPPAAPRAALQPSTSGSTGGPASRPSRVGPQHTDLITRYNLHSRLSETPSSPSSSTSTPSGKGKAPASKQDRMLAHKAKRDEMILDARHKLEAMIVKEAASSSST